jgi:hypothetical protein
MLMLCDSGNELQKRLERMENGREKPQWKKYDAEMVCFPILDKVDVQKICFGNFTLIYIRKHLKSSILDEGQLKVVVELCQQQDNLV